MSYSDGLAERSGLESVAVSGGCPQLEEDEKLEGSYENVLLVIGDAQALGEGQLHITTRLLPSLGLLSD